MFGRSSPELIAARVKIEFLQKENADLREQVRKLQEALVATASPQAYRDQQAEKDDGKPVVASPMEQELDLMKKYMMELEGKPAFSSADEFIRYVKHIDPSLEDSLEEAVTQAPPTLESLHDNEES